MTPITPNVSTAALAAHINHAQDNQAPAESGGFSSLLNISGNVAPPHGAAPQPSATNLPVKQSSQPGASPKIAPADKAPAPPAPAPATAKNTPPAKPSKDAAPSTAEKSPDQDAPQATDATSTPEQPQPVAADTATPPPAQADTQDTEQLKQQLDETLKKISQLLTGMIQSIDASAPPPAPATDATTAVTPAMPPPADAPAAASLAASLTAALQSLTALLAGNDPQSADSGTPQPASSGSATRASAAPVADFSALVTKLEFALQQLQPTGAQQPDANTESGFAALLANADVTQPTAQPPAPQQPVTPQALTDSLQTTLIQLTKLLGQQSATPTPTTTGNTPATAQALPAIPANALQKLAALAQAQQPAPINTPLPTSLASAPAARVSPVVKDLPAIKEVLATTAAVVQIAQQAPGPQPKAEALLTGVQNAAVQPAGLPAASGDSGNNNADDGNSGQQNAPAMAIAPAALSGQAALSGANSPTFAKALSQAAATPLLDQVAFQVKTALNDGSSKVSIQLDPVELGKLDIKLTIGADGKTAVNIIADNKDTLNLLQRDATTLTRTLHDAGLSADSGSLSFNLRGGQQQNQGHGNGNPQAAQNYLKVQPDEETIPSVNVLSRNYVVNLTDGLDIKI